MKNALGILLLLIFHYTTSETIGNLQCKAYERVMAIMAFLLILLLTYLYRKQLDAPPETGAPVRVKGASMEEGVLELLNMDNEVISLQAYIIASFGTNFVFGFIGYWTEDYVTTPRLFITPVAQVAAHVRVTAPFINMDETYTVSNYTIVHLNGRLYRLENGMQGIEVTSDVNISVIVVAGPRDNTEGFLALPVNALGTRYVAASYKPQSITSSEILVVGVESDTDVYLSAAIGGHLSLNRTFRLQKLETYQFKSNEDLSGGIITSNKPVAVFSGDAIAQVPFGVGDGQYLIEQIIPTKYWATKFIIPPIYPRKYFVLKFFADRYNVTIHCYNSTKYFAVNVNKSSTEELLFGKGPVVVVADKPVSVIQYGYDGDNIDGDPFMSTCQSISQFEDSYKFVTQNYNSGTSNTIAITVLKNSTGGLLLNGHALSYWNAKNLTVSPPLDDYLMVLVNVSYNSYYHLYHNDGIKFGAMIYGRYTTTVAYGYPLQLNLNSNDCKHHEAVPSSTVPSVVSVTTAVSSYSTPTVHNGKGTWCFTCEAMSHLKYCDKVSKCRNENEVCYVQGYTRSLDVGLYRSGCINPQQCKKSDESGGCIKCCDGDFCNSAGCGDDGFPAPDQRGPICFDCTHKGEDEECNTVQLCHSNQVCMIEKYEWGDNDFHYIRGCADFQGCAKKRSVSGLSTRHAPVCSHCCHSDFCNMNCTSHDTASAIVG